VIDRAVDTGSSRPADVTVGQNRIGVAVEPAFTGVVLGIERLPPPAPAQ
jgi:hypothetical protein